MDQKRLKVAFLCRDVGKVNRGVETYVLELSKRLAKNQSVEILAGSNAYSLPIIASGKFDIVIPTNGRTQSLKVSLGRMVGKYKVIISGQSGVGKDDIWNILVTMPDIYVALTEAEKKWAEKFVLKTKVVKIPNGVDLEKFSPKGEKVNFNLPAPIIISVGALTWYKHHERTIKALKNLERGSLVIIGAGEEAENLNKLTGELGLRERVRIIKVAFEDIPKFYRSADLFVLPSWDREAFGIVYVEAMASGLAIVAPDDLSRKEIVGPAGILVNTSNIGDYTKAIGMALNKRWGDLPRQQSEKFSWDKISQDYEGLFREMFK